MPSAAVADRTGLLLPQSDALAALVVDGVFAVIAMVLALFWRSKASLTELEPTQIERQLRQDVAIKTERVPVVWDADFLLGLKDATREDSCARCEINARSVHRISDEAHEALTTTTSRRLASRLRRS